MPMYICIKQHRYLLSISSQLLRLNRRFYSDFYIVTRPWTPCRFYITPRSFLDLLGLYGRLMQQQQVSLGTDRERLVNGLTKLRQTNETVDVMQRELTALQPVLQQKTAATEQLLVQVETVSCQGALKHVDWWRAQASQLAWQALQQGVPCPWALPTESSFGVQLLLLAARWPVSRSSCITVAVGSSGIAVGRASSQMQLGFVHTKDSVTSRGCATHCGSCQI